MKLLDKKELNIALVSEQKRTIDQGVLLARKVDTLRAAVSAEEYRLETIKTITIPEVQRTLDIILSQKSSLQAELELMRERKNRMFDDFYREKQKVELKEAALTQKESSLIEREQLCSKKEEYIQEQEKQIQEMKKEALSAFNKTNQHLIDVDNLLKENKKRSDFINEQEKKAQKHIDTQLLAIDVEWKSIAKASEFIEFQKSLLNEKEKQLQEKEIAINDKYETLLQTIEYVERKKR